MKARTRITLEPLVDVLPCMGAVTVSLLEAPYLDCSLRLFGNLDLMMLPVVKDAARFALARVPAVLSLLNVICSAAFTLCILLYPISVHGLVCDRSLL